MHTNTRTNASTHAHVHAHRQRTHTRTHALKHRHAHARTRMYTQVNAHTHRDWNSSCCQQASGRLKSDWTQCQWSLKLGVHKMLLLRLASLSATIACGGCQCFGPTAFLHFTLWKEMLHQLLSGISQLRSGLPSVHSTRPHCPRKVMLKGVQIAGRTPKRVDSLWFLLQSELKQGTLQNTTVLEEKTLVKGHGHELEFGASASFMSNHC